MLASYRFCPMRAAFNGLIFIIHEGQKEGSF